MSKYGTPLGPRVLVKPEQPIDQVTKRAQAAGIIAVVEEKNKPRPTSGVIVAVGNDPLLKELGLLLGVKVSFGHLAGSRQWVEGTEYRLLEAQEIAMILPT